MFLFVILAIIKLCSSKNDVNVCTGEAEGKAQARTSGIEGN